MQEQETVEPLPWSIGIFAARETLEELMGTFASVLSTLSKPAHIDLLINGNEPLAIAAAEQISSWLSMTGAARVRIWSIALGDKAHAWNQYIYGIWPGGAFTFFVDGYVRPDANAFNLLEACLLGSSQVLGATGVPAAGRSARRLRTEMIEQGGIHGNMHCLTYATVKRIKESEFRLPLGIYRTDATLGAALMFNLDPARNTWEPRRIRVLPEASWSTRKREWWRLSDMRSQLKRMLRQAQGELENRAVRQLFAIKGTPVSALPETAAELVLDWIEDCPDEARAILRVNPLCRYALMRLRQSRDWQPAKATPRLLCILAAC